MDSPIESVNYIIIVLNNNQNNVGSNYYYALSGSLQNNFGTIANLAR